MPKKLKYLFLQTSILLLPAILPTYFFQVNDWVENPFTEYLLYICGISGFFTVGILSEILKDHLTETVASLLSISIFTGVAIAIFLKYYEPTKERFSKVTKINTYLAIWSIICGNMILMLAMQ